MAESDLEVVFEKYFDLNHQLPYYFNPQSDESVWTLPLGAKVVDKTGQATQQEQIDEYKCQLK